MNNGGSVFIKVHENVKEKLCMYQTTTLKIKDIMIRIMKKIKVSYFHKWMNIQSMVK